MLTLLKYVFIRSIEHFNSLILAADSHSDSDGQVVGPYLLTSANVVANEVIDLLLKILGRLQTGSVELNVGSLVCMVSVT